MRALVLCALLCATSAYASETATYTYDARGRLKQVVHSGTVNDGVTTTYTIDKADNRTNVTDTVVASPPSFSIADKAVTEGATAVFTVSKTGSGSGTVNYATANPRSGRLHRHFRVKSVTVHLIPRFPSFGD